MVEVRTADLVIVGSGAGGLTAALTARERGLDPIVVEKRPVVGGTSARSGGVLWIPDNPVMKEAGADDSFDAAMTYLEDVVGDEGPATSMARKEAYLRAGPRMIDMLRERGVRFVYCDGYPDYYPHRPGGHERGRALNADIIDLRLLGPWQELLGTQVAGLKVDLLMRTLAEAPAMTRLARTFDGVRTATRVAARTASARLTRHPKGAMGQALTAHLLLAAVRSGVQFWLSTPMRELVISDGAVRGVLVHREGRDIELRGEHGVILASGGFAHNEAMRKQSGRDPVSTRWTAAIPEDTGDGITAGTAIGAAIDLMDEAIWSPSSVLPDGTPVSCLWERAVPHSIMVDSGGSRFCNEAASYMEVGQRMYERHLIVPAVPSWLVFDARHRRRYPFGGAPPAITPRDWVPSGYLKRAASLEDLARQCEIDPAGLRSTVDRFNQMAAAGVDEDFHRGENAYDLEFGDPRHGPNPCLGGIQSAPFYAVAMYPGDVGTSGGLVTDEHARVLDEHGVPLPGLYATGNTTASVMGRVYPGAGASLGPAAVFGYIAANHIAANRS